MIDRQVRAIIDHAYTTCENLLKENMDKLLRVSEALLERETINRKEFEDLFLGQAQPSYDPDKGDIFKEEDISERAKEALKESEKKSADKLAGEEIRGLKTRLGVFLLFYKSKNKNYGKERTMLIEEIFQEIDQRKDEMIQHRRHIHHNAEVSFKEKETADYIVNYYKGEGCRSYKKYGRLRSPGPY